MKRINGIIKNIGYSAAVKERSAVYIRTYKVAAVLKKMKRHKAQA